MTDAGAAVPRFAVVGNPVAHSWSPPIHEAFGRACGRTLSYERVLAPIDPPGGFERLVRTFFAEGGRGMNVTVPFKERAFALADAHTDLAAAAGACNTLMARAGTAAGGALLGDNTDGSGLVRDIEGRLGVPLAGRHVLLLGAGGAARGVARPLIDRGIASLTVANRSLARAERLLADIGPRAVATAAIELAALAAGRPARSPPRFDLVIDATAAGLGEPLLALAPAVFDDCDLAYDMVYAAEPTGFLRQAAAAGVPRRSDGLGMLVEQAARSFALWHGVEPETGAVYADLRRRIEASARPAVPPPAA